MVAATNGSTKNVSNVPRIPALPVIAKIYGVVVKKTPTKVERKKRKFRSFKKEENDQRQAGIVDEAKLNQLWEAYVVQRNQEKRVIKVAKKVKAKK